MQTRIEEVAREKQWNATTWSCWSTSTTQHSAPKSCLSRVLAPLCDARPSSGSKLPCAEAARMLRSTMSWSTLEYSHDPDDPLGTSYSLTLALRGSEGELPGWRKEESPRKRNMPLRWRRKAPLPRCCFSLLTQCFTTGPTALTNICSAWVAVYCICKVSGHSTRESAPGNKAE